VILCYSVFKSHYESSRANVFQKINIQYREKIEFFFRADFDINAYIAYSMNTFKLVYVNLIDHAEHA